MFYQPDRVTWGQLRDLRMRGRVCRTPSAVTVGLLAACKDFSLGKIPICSHQPNSYLRTIKEGLGVQNTNRYSWAASHLLPPRKYFSLGKISTCSYQPHKVTWGQLWDLRMRGWVCRTPSTVTVGLLVAFCILIALHPCLVTTKQRCMYTTSVDIQNELQKATVTHLESQAAKCSASPLERGE